MILGVQVSGGLVAKLYRERNVRNKSELNPVVRTPQKGLWTALGFPRPLLPMFPFPK